MRLCEKPGRSPLPRVVLQLTVRPGLWAVDCGTDSETFLLAGGLSSQAVSAGPYLTLLKLRITDLATRPILCPDVSTRIPAL
jgi:hypothetical protein